MVKSEEVVTDDTILPDSLIVSTRGYIENLGKQQMQHIIIIFSTVVLFL